MTNSRRSGTTLLELTIALGILGVLLGMAVPPFATARDVFAVRAARDAIVSASARARALAPGHGGADLHIDATGGTIRLATRDGTVDETTSITRTFAVGVRLDNTSATSAVIRYDMLGIGRVASRTISLRRGATAGGVTFSSYGRPRVW